MTNFIIIIDEEHVFLPTNFIHELEQTIICIDEEHDLIDFIDIIKN